ncbi:hypothetical protein FJQ98_21170 [Lysinibacillus agricola]|uniref:Uncharacterized protein n=1 Tax=Lysinibacillus agricola TaxID=2590012 RepID=A0ABX7ANZ4_9BACI|nr:MULTISPECIES: hypothetical protein [Lysinibacillus]KOS64855.1 hypothetical protein AN161_00790 [Lysinibacillus sp. FJAT-14222]QQP11670.1 hypothetical protein FJQ98_21170 [Lysinibacillus agricola]
MNQTIENVALDENTEVAIVTTHLEEDIKLVTCEYNREATLFIDDEDYSLDYEDAADILKCTSGDIRRKMLRGYLRLLTAKIA